MWAFMNSTEGVLEGTTNSGIQRVKDEDYAFLMESSSLQYQVVTTEIHDLSMHVFYSQNYTISHLQMHKFYLISCAYIDQTKV